jgi:ribose transport system permease protein
VSAQGNVREAVPSGSRWERIRRALFSVGPIFVVLAVLLFCITLVSPFFLNPPIFLSFIARSAPLMVLAAGTTFVLVSGEFDLSLGSLVTVVVVVAARLSEGEAGRTWWILLVLVGLGVLVGLINGIVTTRLRVPSFITTLGMLLILQGAVFLWTQGAPTGELAENLREFGRGRIDDVPIITSLPYAVLILIAVGAIGVYLLSGADFGRRLFATGGNARAAALSGVNVPNVRTLAFIVSALSAVVAGVLLAGIGGISAQVGIGLEFEAIAAAVLGGVVLGGGRGSVLAAMAGALTLETLFTLLNFLGVPGALEDVVQGVIIIGAVAFASLRGRGG